MKYCWLFLFIVFSNMGYSQINYLDKIEKSASGLLVGKAYGPEKTTQQGMSLFTGNKLLQFGFSYTKINFSDEDDSYSTTIAQPSIQIHSDLSNSIPVGVSLSISYIMSNNFYFYIPKYHLVFTPTLHYKYKHEINDNISSTVVPEAGISQMINFSGSKNTQPTISFRLTCLFTIKRKHTIFITGENSTNEGHISNAFYLGVMVN